MGIEADVRELFGALVKEARLRLGYCQEDLATLVDINAERVLRIESGQGHPNLTVVMRLIGALDLDITPLIIKPNVDPAVLIEARLQRKFNELRQKRLERMAE